MKISGNYCGLSYQPALQKNKMSFSGLKTEQLKHSVENAATGLTVGLALCSVAFAFAVSTKFNTNSKQLDRNNLENKTKIEERIEEQTETPEFIEYEKIIDIQPEPSVLKNDARSMGNYYVEQGETLWGISKKFNTNVDNFMKVAKLSNSELNEGQIIENVPSYCAPKTMSLGDIAKAQNIDTDKLAKLNDLSPETIINEGESVYLFAPTISPEPVEKGTVVLRNGKTAKSDSLYQSALQAGPKGAKRPQVIVDKYGHIKAELNVFEPTNHNGELSGKTIFLNAGHGGYNPKTGLFDPGTKGIDSKGNVLEEWSMNRLLADEIKEQLLDKGAKVVYTSGSVLSVTDTIKENQEKSDIFISVHLNYAPNLAANGYEIFIDSKNNERNMNLAKQLESKLKTSSEIQIKEGDYAILRANTKNPAVLVEAGFMSNKSDLVKIVDKSERQSRAKDISEGVSRLVLG